MISGEAPSPVPPPPIEVRPGRFRDIWVCSFSLSWCFAVFVRNLPWFVSRYISQIQLFPTSNVDSSTLLLSKLADPFDVPVV